MYYIILAGHIICHVTIKEKEREREREREREGGRTVINNPST